MDKKYCFPVYLISAKYGTKLKIVLNDSCPKKIKRWFYHHSPTVGYWISTGKQAVDSLVIVDVDSTRIDIPWSYIKFCHSVE